LSKKNLINLFGNIKDPRDFTDSPPQSLESISSNSEEQEYFIKRIKEFEQTKPKVDYSDFSNFVFFNSALDYFNITGDKILNEYPYDGSKDLRQAFYDDLDDYQKYVIDSLWTKRIGHLRFNPSVSSSYIKIEDVGKLRVGSAVSTVGLLSPATSSLSIEAWCIPPPNLTGSNDIMVLLQKVSGTNGDGYSAYFSGSNIYFKIVSGSDSDQVSAPISPGNISYYCFKYDNVNLLTSIITGSTTKFPVSVSSASSNISARIDLGGVPLYFGSGTLSGKVTRPLTGSLDEVRFWNVARSLNDISGTFNIRQYSQPNLVGAWTFNESGSAIPKETTQENRIVLDHSGYKLHGRIENYFSNIRSSGSLISYDYPDLILTFNAPEIQAIVLEQQTSGSNYDRNNDNLISRLFPEQYIELESEQNTEIFRNLIYLLGRDFDKIKVRIDQFVNVLRQNYGEYNQTPDSLLQEVARFWGWEFTGNFISADANQYIIGNNILHNLENNKEIDKKLYQIKNEFWKRTLLNLIHLYKTKGTRESVESLLRIYGVNHNFVKLKEYGLRPRVGITTQRIHSEKSVPVITFGSASYTGSYILSNAFTSSVGAIECRAKFPTSASSGLTTSDIISGSLWTLSATSGSGFGFPYEFPFMFGGGSDMTFYQLWYAKNAVNSYTGTLFLSSSEGNVELTGVRIFDNRWYNIAFFRDFISGTLNLHVRSLDKDNVDVRITGSLSGNLGNYDTNTYNLWVGATGSFKSQYWMQEVRVWDEQLSNVELDDHCLNYQSYGTEEYNDNRFLKLHWRLNDNVAASAGGVINNIIDVSTNNILGDAYGLKPSDNPFKRFLNDYNYIASPEHGWTEELVRVLPSSKVQTRDAFTGNRMLALEFNMVDALNEDISQIIATMDGFNNAIGIPVNKFRDEYHDLNVLRLNYFKRLQGRLNFRIFSDMLEFFDRSFLTMVRRLIPAHSNFLGDQFVIQSHMLERPKLEYGYRRQERPFEIEGKIVVYERR
jgi:hypothetical protein